jgi:hypothetical protein
MLAIKLATPVGIFAKNFLEGTCVSCWIGKLFPPIVMVATVQPDLARFFCLVSLGVYHYPWEIIGMDFVTVFTKNPEFYLTTIIDSCLLYEMVHCLSCHKKSPHLTKP